LSAVIYKITWWIWKIHFKTGNRLTIKCHWKQKGKVL